MFDKSHTEMTYMYYEAGHSDLLDIFGSDSTYGNADMKKVLGLDECKVDSTSDTR